MTRFVTTTQFPYDTSITGECQAEIAAIGSTPWGVGLILTSSFFFIHFGMPRLALPLSHCALGGAASFGQEAALVGPRG
jgi:hypothetical protein